MEVGDLQSRLAKDSYATTNGFLQQQIALVTNGEIIELKLSFRFVVSYRALSVFNVHFDGKATETYRNSS